MKRPTIRELARKLLHVDDTPRRTALAYSIGVFIGFSPFLGFHTLLGLAIAFVFGLNRAAILLGVWSNMPLWIAPYYSVATGLGMALTGFRLEGSALGELFRLGKEGGFFASAFWKYLASQSGLFVSFHVGSLLLAGLLALAAYPLSFKWIVFYRRRRGLPSEPST